MGAGIQNDLLTSRKLLVCAKYILPLNRCLYCQLCFPACKSALLVMKEGHFAQKSRKCIGLNAIYIVWNIVTTLVLY